MKVYLVWHVLYIDEYESHDDVLCIFDSKEKAANYILNRADCTSVSVTELMESEELVIDSENHFYTNSDQAPEYNLEFYTIEEYELNKESE